MYEERWMSHASESHSHSAFIKVKNESENAEIVLRWRQIFILTSQIKLLHQKSAGMTAELQLFNYLI